MENIITFLADNYVWFLIITLILVFALIGYLVDTKQDDRFTKKITFDTELTSKIDAAKAANITLNDMVQDSKQEVEKEESL